MSEAAKCATVATAEVDLGWVTIKGHKTEQAVSAGVMGSCIIWQYDLNCCVIQIIRYRNSAEWSAFGRDKDGLMHVNRGCKLVNETSQFEMMRAAAESVFGNTQLMWRVLGVMQQMNEEHAENYGDMTMSLGGYFEPFPIERRQVVS